MIAMSLQSNEIDESLRYLLRLMISDFAFSQSEERDLQDFNYYSRTLIRLREFDLSWIIFSFCSMFVILWLNANIFSLVYESPSCRPLIRVFLPKSAVILLISPHPQTILPRNPTSVSHEHSSTKAGSLLNKYELRYKYK
jgi:hypothetical protein